MPESVHMPQEFAEGDYEPEQGEELVQVYAPEDEIIGVFGPWGSHPLEAAVVGSCKSHRDRTGRHYWRSYTETWKKLSC